ncbi:hypothetical protein pb186bvf_020067 [Paramecium bursaria]
MNSKYLQKSINRIHHLITVLPSQGNLAGITIRLLNRENLQNLTPKVEQIKPQMEEEERFMKMSVCMMENGEMVYGKGQWKSDSFNGRGKFVNQDWLNESIDETSFKQFQQVQHHFKSYEGEFKNGQFWGMGTMIFEGGDQQYKYFGQFQCDTFHGIGSIEDNQNQEIIKGKWIYGTLV